MFNQVENLVAQFLSYLSFSTLVKNVDFYQITPQLLPKIYAGYDVLSKLFFTFNQGGEQSKLYNFTQQGQINIEIS